MKVLSSETNLSYATNVGNASVVRIFNSDSSAATVTRKDSGGSTIGTFTVGAGEVIYCEKNYTDTLEGGSTIKVSKTAHSHMMSYASYASSGGGGGSGIVTQNLVLNLDAGDINSWSGSGTSWNDLSGQGNHATLVNGPSFGYGSGGYFNFDGTNDYAALPAIDLTGNEVTFAVWTKTTYQGNVSSLIFLGDSSHASGGRILNIHTMPFSNVYYYFDKGYWASGVYQGYDRLNGTMGSSDWSGWRHWVFTANASTGSMKIYNNGTLFDSSTGNTRPLSNANGDIRRIARSNGTQTYQGEISNLQIYKKELSASEVTQNFDATKSRFGL